MYIHNYLTHLNQNDILKIKIFQEFIFQIYHMLVLFPSFSYLFKSLQPAYFVLVGVQCPFISQRVHTFTLYFDGMAKLQTYQHYSIHPPSTNIDLITKYAMCPILKYYFNYYTQNQCASNMEDCNNPSVCFFLISDFGLWSSNSNEKINYETAVK